jgi:hypothetical protein
VKGDWSAGSDGQAQKRWVIAKRCAVLESRRLASNRAAVHQSGSQNPQPATRVQFRPGAVLRHSSTPARNASRSDAGGPSLRVTGFEDSLSDGARALCYPPLEVGLASEARSTTRRWRSRKDDDEDENEAPGEVSGDTRSVGS